MKIRLLLCGFIIMAFITGCSKDTSTNIKPKEENEISQAVPANNKVLIAYFSRVGNTDFSENVDAKSSASLLKSGNDIMGNTQYLAQLIQQCTGGDLFFIQTANRYPVDYDEIIQQGREENTDRTKLQLVEHVKNFDAYETIFIGYPIWHSDMPLAVYAFLDEYDFAGKTIIPFNTSGGSGFANSIVEIREKEPGAKVVEDGFTITHSNIAELDSEDVQEWLNQLKNK